MVIILAALAGEAHAPCIGIFQVRSRHSLYLVRTAYLGRHRQFDVLARQKEAAKLSPFLSMLTSITPFPDTITAGV
jgi:hypothetical protein